MVALPFLIVKLVLLFGLHVNELASAVVTSYCNLILQAALDKMSKGHMLVEAVAIIGK